MKDSKIFSSEALAEMIHPNEVHKAVYTDPNIFDMEMERIFESTWVYAGHDSQIANPGDYFTVTIGRQPLIVVRDKESGDINVLYNRCTHKGARVVGEGEGCARAFRCCYHGWTFDTDGKLMATPHTRDACTRGFEIGDEKFNLNRVACVEVYRGFIFVNLSGEGQDFKEYFGQSLTSIDNMVDRAPEGELEVAGGVLKYRHTCNWKMFVENLNDNMHPMVTHKSAIDACQSHARTLPEGEEIPDTVNILGPFGSSYDFFDGMSHRVFPNGHSYSGDKQSIHSAYPPVPDYVAAMEKAYGKGKTRDTLSLNRHNTVYYPSATIKGAIQLIRVVRPISVNETEIETYTFRLKGAPDEMLQRTLLYTRLINSPGSIVGHDDWESYYRMQNGLASDAKDWVSMHRQFGNDNDEGDDGITGIGSSELPFRNQYQAWLKFMTGEQAA